MKTVYYIYAIDLKKVVSKIGYDDANQILKKFYHLKGDLMTILSDDKQSVVYWIENDRVKETFNFELYPGYKYERIFSFKLSKRYEDRLQKQETHVIRGDDAEGNRVLGRVCKASITVGHLSHKAIKG